LGPDATTDVLIDAGPGDDKIIIWAGSVTPHDSEDILCGEGEDQVILKGFPADIALKFPLTDPNGGTYTNLSEDCEGLLHEP